MKINRSNMKTDKLLLVCISVVLAITAISEVKGYNSCSTRCCPKMQRCDCCKCDTVQFAVEEQPCCCNTTETINKASRPAPIVTNSTSNPAIRINVEDTISNTNNVHVPITISNVNINTNFRETSSVTNIPVPSSTTISVSPIIVTVTASPFPSSPKPNSCCNVFIPCLSGGEGCQTHYRTCSNICASQQMYLPINPCASNQCFRNDFYTKYACSSHMNYPYFSCDFRQIDCGGCNDDFYRDFSTYSRCSGCFHY